MIWFPLMLNNIHLGSLVLSDKYNPENLSMPPKLCHDIALSNVSGRIESKLTWYVTSGVLSLCCFKIHQYVVTWLSGIPLTTHIRFTIPDGLDPRFSCISCILMGSGHSENMRLCYEHIAAINKTRITINWSKAILITQQIFIYKLKVKSTEIFHKTIIAREHCKQFSGFHYFHKSPQLTTDINCKRKRHNRLILYTFPIGGANWLTWDLMNGMGVLWQDILNFKGDMILWPLYPDIIFYIVYLYNLFINLKLSVVWTFHHCNRVWFEEVGIILICSQIYCLQTCFVKTNRMAFECRGSIQNIFLLFSGYVQQTSRHRRNNCNQFCKLNVWRFS